jgi:Putative bacterial sensory transduction regulator
MANPDLSNAPTSAELDEMLDIQHADVIQTVISSLDPNHTAMVSHGAGGHIWKFTYGSVEVFVQLTGNTDDDVLTVWSQVMALPVKNQPELLEKLLKMNWDSTLESRFAITNDYLVVMSTRTVAELSPGEISRSITLVADVADNNDDSLKAAFPAA